jgi:hypothetical protein
MKIGKIALKIRAAKTVFGNYVAGSAELDTAMMQTLSRETAFVIPLIENADENKYDTGVNQPLYERFGVIAAIKNDDSQLDKLGILAYDRIHDIRNELMGCLLGWEIPEAESLIYYRGGSLVDINGGWLWYQFEFEYKARIGCVEEFDNGKVKYGVQERDVDPDQEPDDFNSIYAQYILSPSANLPYTGDLPIADLTIPDMSTYIDLTKDPRSGAYTKGFASAFDFYKK